MDCGREASLLDLGSSTVTIPGPAFSRQTKNVAWPPKVGGVCCHFKRGRDREGKRERDKEEGTVREKRQVEKKAKKQDGSSSCLSAILQNQLPSSSSLCFLLDAKWLKWFAISSTCIFSVLYQFSELFFLFSFLQFSELHHLLPPSLPPKWNCVLCPETQGNGVLTKRQP